MRICFTLSGEFTFDGGNAILSQLTAKLARSDQALADAVAAASPLNKPHKESTMAKKVTPPTGNPALDALIAQVDAAVTVESSAVVYVNSVPGLITAAVNAALAGGATPAQLAPITDLAAQLAASNAAITAALTANTPTPPPTP